MRRAGVLGTYVPVPGSNGALFIYQVDTSPNWYAYVRCDGKTVRKSTGTPNRQAAFEFARNLAMSTESREGETADFTFRAAAASYLKAEAIRVGFGEVGQTSLVEERIKLKNLIVPAIGDMPLGKLNRTAIAEFLIRITDARNLRFTTRNKYLVAIRKVLKHAYDTGMLSHLPLFPPIKQDDRPRGFFTDEELERLKTRLDMLRRSGKVTPVRQSQRVMRQVIIHEDIIDFIIFASSCFVRPSDLKLLKHRHIRIHRDGDIEVLLLDGDQSKTTLRTSMTMPAAAEAYARIVKRRMAMGRSIDPEGYVFMPHILKRNYALAEIRLHIDIALKAEGLKVDTQGRRRTLYSFRHTAFMGRLINSDIDPVTLALNGRTSVAIISRFYGSHIDATKKLHVFLGRDIGNINSW